MLVQLHTLTVIDGFGRLSQINLITALLHKPVNDGSRLNSDALVAFGEKMDRRTFKRTFANFFLLECNFTHRLIFKTNEILLLAINIENKY